MENSLIRYTTKCNTYLYNQQDILTGLLWEVDNCLLDDVSISIVKSLIDDTNIKFICDIKEILYNYLNIMNLNDVDFFLARKRLIMADIDLNFLMPKIQFFIYSCMIKISEDNSSVIKIITKLIQCFINVFNLNTDNKLNFSIKKIIDCCDVFIESKNIVVKKNNKFKQYYLEDMQYLESLKEESLIKFTMEKDGDNV